MEDAGPELLRAPRRRRHRLAHALVVAPPGGPRAKHDFGLSVSGWSALKSMVRPGKTSYPGITAVLLRSLLVGAVRAQADVLKSGRIDLLLQLPLTGVSLLDFEKVAPVAASGRELAEPLVDAWLAERPDLTERFGPRP